MPGITFNLAICSSPVSATGFIDGADLWILASPDRAHNPRNRNVVGKPHARVLRRQYRNAPRISALCSRVRLRMARDCPIRFGCRRMVELISLADLARGDGCDRWTRLAESLESLTRIGRSRARVTR